MKLAAAVRIAAYIVSTTPASSSFAFPSFLSRNTTPRVRIIETLQMSSSTTNNNKDKIRTLLKGIETGDPASVTVVNETKYKQHNPQTQEGGEGLAILFKRLSKTNPHVNIVRCFEDGEYVFGHTEYDFATRRIGFEVFRFEDGLAVEHWDNIQRRDGPNESGHTMVDGPTEVTDLDRTEFNRGIVRTFVDEILIKRQLERLEQYIDDAAFIQHSPNVADGVVALRSALTSNGIQYDRTHRILAEGCFVLTVNEGSVDGVHTSFYDLFRVSTEGKIVEHWDTVEAVPPLSEWKNNNGKF